MCSIFQTRKQPFLSLLPLSHKKGVGWGEHIPQALAFLLSSTKSSTIRFFLCQYFTVFRWTLALMVNNRCWLVLIKKCKHPVKRTRQFILAVIFLSWSFLQMQACTLDFENEKIDRQNMQHQLHVILKELQKARNQITQLESLVSLEWLN